ncbi:MAG: PHB depolymerase family esterase [Acidobacteriota bacterium]
MKSIKNILFFIVILQIVLLVFPGCSKSVKGKLSNPIEIKDMNGVIRNYNIYFPERSDGDLPLLVYFHGVRSEGFRDKPVLKGYTGSPVKETGLIPFCKANKIVLLEILPSYTYRFLDVDAYGWSPFHKEFGGIEKCIDTVIDEYNIDMDNVYLAGISAGAVMSNHLANRRPGKYNAILSHSQAYISEKNDILVPVDSAEKFKVIICYTKGDYKNLKDICEQSYVKYKDNGFNAVILRNLPPLSHKWSNSTNGRFWRLLGRN